MNFKLPPLPYKKNALEPYISEETLTYHYEKHHKGYLQSLEKAIAGTEHESKPLEEIILTINDPKIFNPGAQVWNHTFYWNCMHPDGGGDPPSEVADLLKLNFGSVKDFKEKIKNAALGQFGSGWAWLVQKEDGNLDIMKTANAENPLRSNSKALLTIDVWEHAYYVDYRNKREEYVNAFLTNLINWKFIQQSLRANSATKVA